VTAPLRTKGFWVLALFLLLTLSACRKAEQAAGGVAQKAKNAEDQAQATAAKRGQERAELAAIPLPTKSLYVDVTDPWAWANPFIVVGPDMLTLRITLADVNPSSMGEGTFLRPANARRQEMQLRLSDLGRAVAAIPAIAWPYGRVIAVAQSPAARPQDRPTVRRNAAAVIGQLNGLGITVEEWPGR
jgi:hypothetical protein